MITRTWTCTDVCGQEVFDSQVITVNDTTAPELSGVPVDVELECGDEAAPANVTCFDNCDGAPFLALFEEELVTGEILRTWFCEDSCGNFTSGSQVISTMPCLDHFKCYEAEGDDDDDDDLVVSLVDQFLRIAPRHAPS